MYIALALAQKFVGFFSHREEYLWARPKHNSNKIRLFP